MYTKLLQNVLHINKSLVNALFTSNLLDGNIDILSPKCPPTVVLQFYHSQGGLMEIQIPTYLKNPPHS